MRRTEIEESVASAWIVIADIVSVEAFTVSENTRVKISDVKSIMKELSSGRPLSAIYILTGRGLDFNIGVTLRSLIS